MGEIENLGRRQDLGQWGEWKGSKTRRSVRIKEDWRIDYILIIVFLTEIVC